MQCARSILYFTTTTIPRDFLGEFREKNRVCIYCVLCYPAENVWTTIISIHTYFGIYRPRSHNNAQFLVSTFFFWGGGGQKLGRINLIKALFEFPSVKVANLVVSLSIGTEINK